jgi:sulfite reductase (NADPH) hemoprotein beta-component
MSRWAVVRGRGLSYSGGVYQYDEIDQTLVDERVRQFRDQTRRFLAGELSEDDFRPLRLRNGLYIQRHAPMLRVAIPYGLLAARQLRMLAHIARKYDRDYGHFTTRQNIQFNWPKLEDVPDILADLATVQMHAIQTSGNCIRNVTSDHLAGVARDHPPVVDAAPRVQLSAAQVQDRGDRRADRSRRIRDS